MAWIYDPERQTIVDSNWSEFEKNIHAGPKKAAPTVEENRANMRRATAREGLLAAAGVPLPHLTVHERVASGRPVHETEAETQKRATDTARAYSMAIAQAGGIPEFESLIDEEVIRIYPDEEEIDIDRPVDDRPVDDRPVDDRPIDERIVDDRDNALDRSRLSFGLLPYSFQHPYAADSYSVPHMQTGGLWEGLGAEYQPGTVEGLGLLAGDAYAPYSPLRQGLLSARPSFMGTPRGFTNINFKGGLGGKT